MTETERLHLEIQKQLALKIEELLSTCEALQAEVIKLRLGWDAARKQSESYLIELNALQHKYDNIYERYHRD